MRFTRILLIAVFTMLTALAQAGVASAFPPLPSSFYGTVLLNNTNLLDGTPVQALINDQVLASAYTQTYQGVSVFSLDVPGDDSSTATIEGGKEGDVIQFKIGGLKANETGTWHSGTNIELALTITSTATVEPPQPTRTPFPTQTPIVVIPKPATATPGITPLVENTTSPQSGESAQQKPTDDETDNRTSVSTTAAAVEQVSPERKSNPLGWQFILITMIGILSVAAVIWMVIKRHGSKKQ